VITVTNVKTVKLLQRSGFRNMFLQYLI